MEFMIILVVGYALLPLVDFIRMNITAGRVKSLQEALKKAEDRLKAVEADLRLLKKADSDARESASPAPSWSTVSSPSALRAAEPPAAAPTATVAPSAQTPPALAPVLQQASQPPALAPALAPALPPQPSPPSPPTALPAHPVPARTASTPAIVPSVAQPAPRPADVKEAPPPPWMAWVQTAKAWLFGGNLVAKVGLLILFIGLAFLLRLASDYVVLPVEARLAGVAALALALLTWGWRIRETRSAIGLPTQGAALATLMLVTFSAYRLFHVIPSTAAFGCLLALVVFTCVLAGLQNAMWLAIFGIAGGFATPILTSSGQGSHVGLFSYYALLNAGILGLAWKKSWRPLNLLGFAFTFVIGTTWGVLRYAPEHYLSTQAFLVLFWLFYVAIATFYALRQAPQLKSYVDGTLVFGVPLAAMGLQYGLVKAMPLGLALSALAMGLTYAALAAGLWRWRQGSLRLLVEAFLAMAIVMCTLCIPLALDGRWTSAAWALEGAAITWMGLRQQRRLAWQFGLLVQLGSWVAFAAGLSGLEFAEALVGNLWLGFLVLGITAAGVAHLLRRQAEDHSPSLSALATGFITMAVTWLLAGAWTEVWLRAEGAQRGTLLVLSALALCALVRVVAGRLQWTFPVRLTQAVFGLAGLVFVSQIWDRLLPSGTEWLNDSLATLVLDSPLLGAALLCGGALWSAMSLNRSARQDAAGASPGSASLWLLVAAFWWFGFVLPPLCLALSWLSAQPTVPDMSVTAVWHYLPPGPLYALAMACSVMAWVSVALRQAFPNRRWMMLVFSPALTALGTVLFAWQSMQEPGSALAAPSLGEALTQTPLWGALCLAGIWARGAWRHHRSTQADFAALADDVRQRSQWLWVLGLGITWLGGVCEPVAALLQRSPANLPWGMAWGLCVLLSTVGFIVWAQRKEWPLLARLATPAWGVQALVSIQLLHTLFLSGQWPATSTWALWALAWIVSAWLLQPWLRGCRAQEEREMDGSASGSMRSTVAGATHTVLLNFDQHRWSLQVVHVLRVVAPWLTMIGALSVGLGLWLGGGSAPKDATSLALQRGAGLWADYLAAWAGIVSLFVLLKQSDAPGGSLSTWLLSPLQRTYRQVWIPLGTLWAALLVAYWNLRQDGSMPPLPYLPLMNPLDLTTGLVMALVYALLMRQNDVRIDGLRHVLWNRRGPWMGTLAFVGFNLVLLRTASQWLNIPYEFHALFASQFVQSMWSLVWSLCALVAMWWASRHAGRTLWMTGAALLGVVVIKLLLIDLSNVGSVARIVSFIGVGGLMLAIGYLAPMPTPRPEPDNPKAPS